MNKREYKKAIDALGTAMCVEIFNIGVTTKGADSAKINEAINIVWEAMDDAKRGANLYFPKKVREFADRAAYNRERNQYYSAAFERLNSKFETQVDEALKLVNAATPKEK